MINNEDHNKGININIIVAIIFMPLFFVLLRISNLFSYKWSLVITLILGIIGFFICRLGYYVISKEEYDEEFERLKREND